MGGRGHVLVVDDDRDIRATLAELLQLEGYDVETAGDGLEALAKLDAGLQPTVVLVDLMMPVMNGFELLKQLRCNRADQSLPVIVISANRDYDAEDLGVAAVLRKPFDIEGLLRSVERFGSSSSRPPQPGSMNG
jgi:CheY-like chemotaxis protein